MFHMLIGIAEQTITSIRQEASCGSAVFSSSTKWYKVSRQRVLVDTFDREVITSPSNAGSCRRETQWDLCDEPTPVSMTWKVSGSRKGCSIAAVLQEAALMLQCSSNESTVQPQFSLESSFHTPTPLYPLCALVLHLFAIVMLNFFVSVVLIVVVVVLYMFECGM